MRHRFLKAHLGSSVEVQELKAENANLKKQLEELKKQNSELKKHIEELADELKKVFVFFFFLFKIKRV
jgi:cell division protein FtsB